MVEFAGKYVRTKEVNQEKFLQRAGFGLLTRKAAVASVPTAEITETSPGRWRIVTYFKTMTDELEFEPSVPSDKTTFDGKTYETTVTFEGHRWITYYRSTQPGGKNVTTLREFSDDGIYLQAVCEDVACVQVFKRL